jgi:hypothetical protein
MNEKNEPAEAILARLLSGTSRLTDHASAVQFLADSLLILGIIY